MEKRKEFLADYVSGDWTMSELCRMHGISRPTGYAVLRRYAECGEEGLAERSHAPARHPNQTPAEIEQLVLGLRREHPLWGPRPLKKVLEDRNPGLAMPAASTIGTMLTREGLTRHRGANGDASSRTGSRLRRSRRPTMNGPATSRAGCGPATGSASIR
jgi:hypothetical protein